MLDKTSPKLLLMAGGGPVIRVIKLELCRATGKKEKYMEYLLWDAWVSSVVTGGRFLGKTLPMEEVEFSYAKITWNYIETDHRTGKPVGHVETHWDLVENKGA